MTFKFLTRLFSNLKSYPRIHLEDDADVQQELCDFVSTCFEKILDVCSDPKRKLIQRDYAFVPMVLPMENVEKELREMVRTNAITKGYVHVWISSDRVVNWCIDHEKNRL